MSFLPVDTSPEALEVQRSALGGLDPDERVRAALQMSESIRSVRLAGLRSQHPDASERELVARFIAGVQGVRLDPAG